MQITLSHSLAWAIFIIQFTVDVIAFIPRIKKISTQKRINEPKGIALIEQLEKRGLNGIT